MKYKNGLIFICLIICLFSIASVCASEVNETDVASDNQNSDLIEIENQEKTDFIIEKTIEEVTNENVNDTISNNKLLSSHSEGNILEATKTRPQLNISEGVATLTDADGNALSNQILIFKIFTRDDQDSDKKMLKFSRVLTDENGNVTIPVSGVATGKYILKTTYDGNNQYASFSQLNTITISSYIADDYEVDSNSLTALSNLIKNTTTGNVLNLTQNYHFISIVNGSSDITQGIRITKSITINGNGQVIDGLNLSRIFQIRTNNVTLKNIIFKNCNVTPEFYDDLPTGGAIFILGSNCKLINCTFINSQLGGDNIVGAEISSYGGALYSYGENIELVDCNFINNNAKYGGAIYCRGGLCTISNSSFLNNSADYTGGSISYEDVWATDNCLNLNNCNFSNCNSGSLGGAIYCEYTNLIIINCNFTNNTAVRNGNAIYSRGHGKLIDSNINNEDIFNITNFDFIDTHPGTFTDLANDIANAGDELNLTKNYIYNNTDSSYNSGIIINKKIIINGNGHIIDAKSQSRILYLTGSNIIIKNITFINAHSTYSVGNGGAIYNSGKNCTINLCTFTNCFTDNLRMGGAIYNYGVNFTINLCNFTDCSSYESGAIHNTGDNCNIGSCIFSNCNSSKGSGVICNWGGDNCNVYSSNFTNCFGLNGGAIFNRDGINYNVSLCTFTNCSATFNGAIDNYGVNCNIKLCTFIKCNSSSGGIISNNAANLNVNNCNFIKCQASNDGRAILNTGDDCNINSCNFTDYHSSNGGRAIFNNRKNGKINSCRFTNCSSGAIRNEGDNCNINSCTFINCNSSENGGDIHNTGDNLLLNSCSFINSSAKYGGSVYNEGNNFVLNSCNFTNSSSNKYGGAIGNIGSNFTLISCNFKNCNSSSYGGAIYGGTIIKSCAFINCFGYNGGAINVGANCNISLCNFTNCQPSYRGGAVFASKNCTINLCNFIDCPSNVGVVSIGENCTINSCNFTNCISNRYAGAIYTTSNICTINSCNFNNCQANLGGAIYNTCKNCTINSCNFTNCSSYYGGAICNGGELGINDKKAGNYTAINCLFINNSAITNGGAVYDGTVIDCYFKNNKANGEKNDVFNTLVYNPKLSVHDFISTYNSQEKILINFTKSNGVPIINANITIRVYKNNVLIDTSYCLSNEEWLVNLDAGKYIAEFSVENQLYNVNSINATIIINKISSTVFGAVDNITFPEITIVNIKSSVDGVVTIKIDNNYVNNTFVVANEITPITFDNIHVGKHNVTVKLDPTNKNYNESIFNTTFVVSKKETSITVSVNDSVYGDDIIVNVTANEDGKITIVVRDVIYERNVFANTLVKFNLGILSADDYELNVNFDAGNDYKIATKKINFVVSPAMAEITELQVNDNNYGDNTIIKVKTSVGGLVTVKMNTIVKTLLVSANTLTSFDLGICDADFYSVDVTLDAGNNYTKPTTNKKVTISPKKTSIQINVKNSTYGEKVIVGVTPTENGIVSIKLGEITKQMNVIADTQNNIDFGIIDANSYALRIDFTAGSNYIDSNATNNIIISKTTSHIVVLAVSTVYNGGKYFIATLTDNNGKTIVGQSLSINLNGVKTLKTDKNGQVKLSTNDLPPNVYAVTITFDGNNNYGKSTATAKVTVTKATPKLTAKAKTFKKSVKTKKYSITLKTNQNKPMKNTKVTIKINKKTYTAKTNAKGVATFKIKKLTKKGTFKSTVTYKGDKYYNKVTKTVKIKVK